MPICCYQGISVRYDFLVYNRAPVSIRWLEKNKLLQRQTPSDEPQVDLWECLENESFPLHDMGQRLTAIEYTICYH